MTIFSYSLFLLSFSIFSYLFIDQNFFPLKSLYSGFATTFRQESTILFTTYILGLFVFYIKFLKKKPDISKLKLIITISIISLVFSYPAFLSFDIFNYIATAKTTFFYGENPYIVMPIEFIGDQMLLFTHAANKIALYGPFWIGLTSIPFFIGQENYLLTIFSFKALLVLFYIGTVYFLWKLSKNVFSVSLFALSPLVLIETVMSSHNDIVMMFFAFSAFYSLKNKKILLAIILITLSMLIKYATVFLLPIFIYSTIKILRRESIDWQKVYLLSFFSMFVIFLFSHFREEIYPWYAIWFLPFAALSRNKLAIYMSIAFSFGLLFRYVPFILYGTHFGLVPVIKNLVTFIPPFIVLIFYKSRWLKTFL